jgi:hypothetical protein
MGQEGVDCNRLDQMKIAFVQSHRRLFILPYSQGSHARFLERAEELSIQPARSSTDFKQDHSRHVIIPKT